jgi:hypothetical protein
MIVHLVSQGMRAPTIEARDLRSLPQGDGTAALMELISCVLRTLHANIFPYLDYCHEKHPIQGILFLGFYLANLTLVLKK